MDVRGKRCRVFVSHSQGSQACSIAADIRQQIETEGHEGYCVDDMLLGRSLVDSVQAAIAECDAVIIVLEDASPSVYFEAGLGSALGKQMLMVGGNPVQQSSLDSFYHVPTSTSPKWWREPVRQFVASACSLGGSGGENRKRETIADFAFLLEQGSLIGALGEADLIRLVTLIVEARGATVVDETSLGSPYADARVDAVADTPEGTTVIECKALPVTARLSVDAVQGLEYVLEKLGQHVRGLLVTSGQITDAARYYAQDSDVEIELWDSKRVLQETRDALEREKQ